MHVVKVQPLDADGPQQGSEIRQFLRQGEVDGKVFAGTRPVQLHRVAGRRLEIEHFAAGRDECRQIVHVAADASAPWMGYEQQRALRSFGKAQQVDAARERPDGVACQHRRLLVGEGRIQLGECKLRAARQFARFACTKSHMSR